MNRGWAAPALAAAASCAIFLPVLDFSFVGWDDPIHFLDVPAYRGLSWEHIKWMFTSAHLGLYQPLSWLSLAIDFKLWGLDPWGHHLTNLLLHGANAALFSLIARRVLEKAFPRAGEDDLWFASLASALLFALHPLRVEVVAWITQRRELVAVFFAMSSTLFYLRWLKAGARSSYWISLGLFAAGLLSKATVMCLPAAFVILDRHPFRRGLKLREKIPYFAAALAAAAAAYIGQAATGQIASWRDFGLSARLCQSVYGLMFYLYKTLIPARLLPLYEFPKPFDPLAWYFLAAFVGLLLLLCVLAVFHRRGRPAPAAAFAAYAALSLPVIGLAKTGEHLAADRFTYLSLLPAAILAGAGMLTLLRSGHRKASVACLIALSSALGGLSRMQARIWRDSKSLWTHTLSIDPQHAVAHNSLGTALAEEGRFKEAAERCAEAARLKPGFIRAWDNLGRAYIRLKRFDDAIAAFDSGLAAAPDDSSLHANKGLALAGAGRLTDAVQSYRRSTELRPGAASVHYNFGVALLRLGENARALEEFETAGRLAPASADLLSNQGLALARLGRMDEAETYFRRSLELQPTGGARDNLARALLKKRRAIAER